MINLGRPGNSGPSGMPPVLHDVASNTRRGGTTGGFGAAHVLPPLSARTVPPNQVRAHPIVGVASTLLIASLWGTPLGNCTGSPALAIADRLHRLEQILGKAVRLGPQRDVVQRKNPLQPAVLINDR